MAAGTGDTFVDFGDAPGSNEAFAGVVGLTEISDTSKAEAFFMGDDTSADHTSNDHKYAPTFISLTCGTPTAGVGFNIYARSHHKMTGKWTVRYVWAD